MGSNSSSAHASYGVVPSVTVGLADPLPTKAVESALATAKNVVATGAPVGGDPVQQFAEFSEAIKKTQINLALAELDGEDTAALAKELQETCTTYLGGLTTGELRRLAKADGFVQTSWAHSNDLVEWLRPDATPDSAAREAIQAAALHRSSSASLKGAREPAANYTAQEVGELTGKFEKAAAKCHDLLGQGALEGKDIARLIIRENQMFLSGSPAHSSQVIDNDAKYTVDDILAAAPVPAFQVDHTRLLMGLSDEDGRVLSPLEYATVLRRSTPDDLSLKLRSRAAQRRLELRILSRSDAVLTTFKSQADGQIHLPQLANAHDKIQAITELARFKNAATAFVKAQTKINEWIGSVPGGQPAAPSETSVSDLKEQVAAWSTRQDPTDLRRAARVLGFADTDTATIDQVSDWIAGASSGAIDE